MLAAITLDRLKKAMIARTTRRENGTREEEMNAVRMAVLRLMRLLRLLRLMLLLLLLRLVLLVLMLWLWVQEGVQERVLARLAGQLVGQLQCYFWHCSLCRHLHLLDHLRRLLLRGRLAAFL